MRLSRHLCEVLKGLTQRSDVLTVENTRQSSGSTNRHHHSLRISEVSLLVRNLMLKIICSLCTLVLDVLKSEYSCLRTSAVIGNMRTPLSNALALMAKRLPSVNQSRQPKGISKGHVELLALEYYSRSLSASLRSTFAIRLSQLYLLIGKPLQTHQSSRVYQFCLLHTSLTLRPCRCL